MSKHLELILKTSNGALCPVSNMSVQIMFDNMPRKNKEQVGIKLMLAMVLYGMDSEITQELSASASEMEFKAML